MSTSIMKPLRLLPVALLVYSALAHADCRTFQDGSTYCTGPQGYQATGRSYTGGLTETWDNRGNTATVRQDGMGNSYIEAPNGVAPSVTVSPVPERKMYPDVYPRIYPK